ncbi:HINFP factor, partial [Tricholaema leucomelas]|nr:HINFP factor [Tricholaema leucomelas]
ITCILCVTICTSAISLKAHIRLKYGDEHPLHCHLCDSSLENLDLHKHVETQNDSDAYSCDVEGCGFTSWALLTLRQHYKKE